MNSVVASWSGGIDSTAVIGNLLKRGYNVMACVLDIYPHRKHFALRESKARLELESHLLALAQKHGGTLSIVNYAADWIWAFSHDSVEIPRRNKHILDFMIVRVAMPQEISNLALGEYTGADTWLVRDHVGASDADHRALSAYLYLEYGINYRLISLQDFGESRYKSDRLRLGINALGIDAMQLTTNCLEDSLTHCGNCYKCVERAAAFRTLGVQDETHYAVDPKDAHRFTLYLRQMQGEKVESHYVNVQKGLS